jgi:hypothetical protein
MIPRLPPPQAPDAIASHAEAAGKVEVLELWAVPSQLLDRSIPNVGVNCQREAAEASAAPLCQVHDGLVLELAAGGEVQLLQGWAAVSQATQRQPVHPVTVRERQALQPGTALSQRSKRTAAQLPAAGQYRAPQLRIPCQHRHQVLVR